MWVKVIITNKNRTGRLLFLAALFVLMIGNKKLRGKYSRNFSFAK